MSYKGLNDARRRRALAPFLMAANLFPGNLVVVMVSKKLKRLFDNPGGTSVLSRVDCRSQELECEVLSSPLARRYARSLAHFGCLAASSQDLLWVTDQDEIAPNSTKHDHAGHVIHHCLEWYAPDLRGVLMFATTEANVDNFLLRDAVAITDLAAGCLVDAFGASNRGSERALWISPFCANAQGTSYS